jgi:hypothetical protein
MEASVSSYVASMEQELFTWNIFYFYSKDTWIFYTLHVNNENVK